MKIEIDRANKIVRPVGQVNLKEFLAEVQKLVENWYEYTLDTNVNINWNTPAQEPYRPSSPWAEPYKYLPLTGDPYQGNLPYPYVVTFSLLE